MTWRVPIFTRDNLIWWDDINLLTRCNQSLLVFLKRVEATAEARSRSNGAAAARRCLVISYSPSMSIGCDCCCVQSLLCRLSMSQMTADCLIFLSSPTSEFSLLQLHLLVLSISTSLIPFSRCCCFLSCACVSISAVIVVNLMRIYSFIWFVGRNSEFFLVH